MKTLGLIGGTSWHSTIDYYRYINKITEERLGAPPINPPLLIYSLNVDLMRRNDWDEINKARHRIHKIIAEELTRGVFEAAAKQFVIEEMEKLKSEGVEGIILGCTELPMLVKPQDFDLPLLDTTFLHARKAVDFVLG